MKRLLLISSLLLSTSAFAGNNILTLSPGVATNNIMFNDVVALQHVEKAHPTKGKITKGKLTNKLEESDENPFEGGEVVGILPGDEGSGDGNGGELIDDNGKVVRIVIDPRERQGLEEGWGLEPRCACIGIEHIPLKELEYPEFPPD